MGRRRVEVAVPEGELHLLNVCTFPDKMDGMAVPERVRVNAITNARQTRIILNKLPHPYA